MMKPLDAQSYSLYKKYDEANCLRNFILLTKNMMKPRDMQSYSPHKEYDEATGYAVLFSSQGL